MTDDLPPGWTAWNEGDDGRVVWVYRPDVFDADEFPAPCLPTLYVTRGAPDQRPGTKPGTDWHVAFYLEPEVRVRDCDASAATREAALEAARDLASAFAAGDVDYRSAYQVPREGYLDRLDEATGREA